MRKISQQVFYQNEYVAEGFCFYKHFADEEKTRNKHEKFSPGPETETFQELLQTVSLVIILGLPSSR